MVGVLSNLVVNRRASIEESLQSMPELRRGLPGELRLGRMIVWLTSMADCGISSRLWCQGYSEEAVTDGAYALSVPTKKTKEDRPTGLTSVNDMYLQKVTATNITA
jgi:hypothetical protein